MLKIKGKNIIYYLMLSSLWIIGCDKDNTPALSADQKINLANTFYNNELFAAAINEYLEFLRDYPVEPNKRANINYTIANIYFERLNNYTKAMEYYLRVKHLYPESPLQKEVGKRLVSCLERLERSQDAQRILERETALKPEEVLEHKPGEIIARIGEENVTQGDLDFEIKQLPPYLQNQIQTREQKLEFLKQYIAERLLYDSAKRKGLDQDKEIIEGTYRAKRRLMAQRILTEELQGKVNINDADVELYYKANKDKYVEKDEEGKVVREKSFRESAQQVAQDLFLERQEKAYQELIDRLTRAEEVKIFDNKIN